WLAFCRETPVKWEAQVDDQQTIQTALRHSLVHGRRIVTARDTSALLVVDMQNDFLAKGGYYDEKAKRTRAKQGKLSATDIDDLACVYLYPPTTCEIKEPYQ